MTTKRLTKIEDLANLDYKYILQVNDEDVKLEVCSNDVWTLVSEYDKAIGTNIIDCVLEDYAFFTADTINHVDENKRDEYKSSHKENYTESLIQDFGKPSDSNVLYSLKDHLVFKTIIVKDEDGISVFCNELYDDYELDCALGLDY